MTDQDFGNFLAALSRDTLADVIDDLQQAIKSPLAAETPAAKDGNEDLKPVLDQAIRILTDKNE